MTKKMNETQIFNTYMRTTTEIQAPDLGQANTYRMWW